MILRAQTAFSPALSIPCSAPFLFVGVPNGIRTRSENATDSSAAITP
jgi:hypothetical protein